MARAVSRTLSPLLLPLLLLAAALYAVARPQAVPIGLDGLLPQAPHVFALVGAALAVRLGSSRVALMLLLVLAAEGALSIARAGSGTVTYHLIMLPAFTVLLPLNLLALAFRGRRRQEAPSGIVWCFAFALQGFAVIFLASGGAGLLDAQAAGMLWRDGVTVLNGKMLHGPLNHSDALTDAGLIAFALAGLLLAGRVLVTARPVDAGALIALIALGIALARPEHAAGPWYTAAAALILAVALVHESARGEPRRTRWRRPRGQGPALLPAPAPRDDTGADSRFAA